LRFAKKGLEINPYCGYCSKIIQNLES